MEHALIPVAGYAKRHDIITKKWKRCLAVLVSPACLLTVVIPMVLFFQMDLPAKCGFSWGRRQGAEP